MPKVILDFEAITQLSFDLKEIARSDITLYLIKGKRSRLSAHRVVTALSQRLPKCQVHELKDAGHMGPLTHKERVNQLILSLIGS